MCRCAPEVVGDRVLPHLHPTDLIRRQQPRTRSQGIPLHRPLHSYHSAIINRVSFLTVLGTKPCKHECWFSIKCSMLLNSLSRRDAWEPALTAQRQKVQFNKSIRDARNHRQRHATNSVCHDSEKEIDEQRNKESMKSVRNMQISVM